MSEEFETNIKAIAQHLPYPPTPPLRRPRQQTTLRLRWQRVALLILLAALSSLAIPEVRAAVLAFLRIGAVRIDLEGTTTTGQPLHLEEIAGETTLADARTRVSFDLLTSPDDPPDRVFVQDSLVILVWLSGDEIERALYQIPDFDWMVIKSAQSNILSSTTVRHRDGLWLDMAHPVRFMHDGEEHTDLTHFVTGPVLIWTSGRVTYRLETHDSLTQARRFAESLVVLPDPRE